MGMLRSSRRVGNDVVRGRRGTRGGLEGGNKELRRCGKNSERARTRTASMERAVTAEVEDASTSMRWSLE